MFAASVLLLFPPVESAEEPMQDICDLSAGTIRSVKPGKWSDPATWGGRLPGPADVPVAMHDLVYDQKQGRYAGVIVSCTGSLEYAPSESHAIESTGNVVVYGTLKMRPAAAEMNHTLIFTGIDESKFTGDGMEVLKSDVGLWVMGDGTLDLLGSSKTPWTRTANTVPVGATSFPLKAAPEGWRAGDEIVVVPTNTPSSDGRDWDGVKAQPIDPYIDQFERRRLTGIDGSTVNIDAALLHDSHQQVEAGGGARRWTPEVLNLTRNVKIGGTVSGRTHIYIRSTKLQRIRYVEMQHMGPRKVQPGHARPALVQGRYGLHFHHCGEGSRGSIVEGCAHRDNGSRVFVPHVSHGITMRNNVSFNSMEEAFWWDFQDLTHDTIWEDNVLACVRNNGIDSKSTGMLLGQGDGNIARRNVAIYAHSGDTHSSGAYLWNANNEGVWEFEDNLAHSCGTGLLVWQNTGTDHVIANYDSYHCQTGIVHGAYINSYTYVSGYHYKSPSFNEASSGNANGVVFQDVTFDGGGALPYVVELCDSPVPSFESNKWIRCKFTGYTQEAVRVFTAMEDSNVEKQHKWGDLIHCQFSGRGYRFDNSPYQMKDGFRMRVQPLHGKATQTQRIGQREVHAEIAKFAPGHYGSGRGLRGEYFNGSNFEQPAFSRRDSMVMFQQWSIDRGASPTGVHYRISGDAFSVRWTGRVEAQVDGEHFFMVQGSGGHRLKIGELLLVDSLGQDPATNEEDEALSSKVPVRMKAGEQLPIRLETANRSGARGCTLLWKAPHMNRFQIVPMSQLYTE